MTCSDCCRQRLKRRRESYRGLDAPRALEQAIRAADRTLDRIERRVGSLAIPVGGSAYLTLRDRLRIRLMRGEVLPFCAVCGMPYVLDTWRKHPVCSKRCARRYQKHGYAVIDAMYYYRKLYDRRVEDQLEAGELVPLCGHCGIPFVRDNKRRRYCSDKCKDAAYWKRRPLRRCWCGKEYRGRASTCSTQCCKNLRRRTGCFCARCERAVKPGCAILPNEDTVLPTRRRTYKGFPTITSQREIVFCSGRCRDARGWSPMRKTCEHCGTAYYPRTQSQVPQQKYCSAACRNRVSEQNRRAQKQRLTPSPEAICQHCGTVFERTHQAKQPPRYCSADCKRAADQARRQERRERQEAPIPIPVELFRRERVPVGDLWAAGDR